MDYSTIDVFQKVDFEELEKFSAISSRPLLIDY